MEKKWDQTWLGGDQGPGVHNGDSLIGFALLNYHGTVFNMVQNVDPRVDLRFDSLVLAFFEDGLVYHLFSYND